MIATAHITYHHQDKPALNFMTMPTEIFEKIVDHLLRDCADIFVIHGGLSATDNSSLAVVSFPTRVMKLVIVSKEFSRIAKPVIWSRLSKKIRIWDFGRLPRSALEGNERDDRLKEKALTLLNHLLDHGWVEQTRPIFRKP